MTTIIQALRPRQWTKNLLVFAVPLFSFKFLFEIWFLSFISFVSFCLISSSVYLINDCLDIESDRLHPIKKNRAIASGKISTKFAVFLSILLTSLSLFISFYINPFLFLLIFLYGLIQVAYCLRLKQEPLFDILCISSGFLLRALSGGVATDLFISPWFILSVGTLALFLAIEKRKAELRLSISKGVITRKVLKRYSLPLLLRLENMVATSSFIMYSLWAAGPVTGGASTSLMMLTIPFVLLGIFRYQFLSDPDESFRRSSISSKQTAENPEEILLNDKGIRLIIISWIVTILIIGFQK